jgi:hypothetical protein
MLVGGPVTVKRMSRGGDWSVLTALPSRTEREHLRQAGWTLFQVQAYVSQLSSQVVELIVRRRLTETRR